MDTIVPAQTKQLGFSEIEFDSACVKGVVYDVSGVVVETTEKHPCLACCKQFTTKASLKRHHERFPVCILLLSKEIKIEDIKPNSQILPLDELVQNFVNQSYFDIPFVCRYCKENFANRGNLNRHFTTSVACSRLAIDRFNELWIKK